MHRTPRKSAIRPQNPVAPARPASRSFAYTEYLLDVLPSGLPFGVVDIDVGFSTTGEKSLKGIGFRPEEIVSRNDLRHKSRILELDRPGILQFIEPLFHAFDDLNVGVEILTGRILVVDFFAVAIC